jgi:hypothetical protein
VTVVPLVIEWAPPWDGPLAEDHELQERAAERLALYLRQGRLWVGDVPIQVVDAKVDNLARTTGNPGHTPYVVRWRLDLTFDVKVRG